MAFTRRVIRNVRHCKSILYKQDKKYGIKKNNLINNLYN